MGGGHGVTAGYVPGDACDRGEQGIDNGETGCENDAEE